MNNFYERHVYENALKESNSHHKAIDVSKTLGLEQMRYLWLHNVRV